MIADQENAMAIAGVIGGLHSAIDAEHKANCSRERQLSGLGHP